MGKSSLSKNYINVGSSWLIDAPCRKRVLNLLIIFCYIVSSWLRFGIWSLRSVILPWFSRKNTKDVILQWKVSPFPHPMMTNTWKIILPMVSGCILKERNNRIFRDEKREDESISSQRSLEIV